MFVIVNALMGLANLAVGESLLVFFILLVLFMTWYRFYASKFLRSVVLNYFRVVPEDSDLEKINEEEEMIIDEKQKKVKEEFNEQLVEEEIAAEKKRKLSSFEKADLEVDREIVDHIVEDASKKN